MKKLILAISMITLMILAGCSTEKSQSSQDDAPLQIVATYSIIADMITNIAGDKAEVYSMVPIGTDPHMYDPLPRDTQRVSQADLIFYNGLNLETGKGWFQDLLKVTRKTDVAYQVSEQVTPLYLSEKGQETEEDPHAWLDINNAKAYVDLIAARLIEADPDNRDYYLQNQTAYLQQLDDLDSYAKAEIEKIPADKRILVTSEGAFKYFSQAYGFEAAYIWEINTDNQGTPEQMNRIIDIIQSSEISALFVETSINPKTMETISSETGVPIHANIFTDSLAKPGEIGDTYLTMFKWNIDKIVEGLTP